MKTHQEIARELGEKIGEMANTPKSMDDTYAALILAAILAALDAAAQEQANANHDATADAKAEDIATYFIDTILKTNWDRDHMTRVLEGWLSKHRAEVDQLRDALKLTGAEISAVRAGGAKVIAECNDLRAQIRELTTGEKL